MSMVFLSHCMILLVFLICYAGGAVSLARFCKIYLGCSVAAGRIFTGILLLGGLILGIVCEKCDVPYLIGGAGGQFLFTALIVAVFRAGREKKVLLAAILIVIRELLWNLCSSFLSWITLILLHGIKGEQTVCISVWQDHLIGALSWVMVIRAAGHCRARMASVFESRDERWYRTLAAPLFLIILVYDLICAGSGQGIMVVSDAGSSKYWNLYSNQILSHAAVCILTALLICIAWLYVSGMDRIRREQRARQEYGLQVAYYKMLEEQYGQMERLRHDMKNHLIWLRGLWENRDWERLGDYLSGMTESGELGEGEEATGSRALDALLYRKRQQARDGHIAWECHVEVGPPLPVPEFDLCVLIGNIVDNAIESCMRMQDGGSHFIKIRAGSAKQCFLLEAKNSTALKHIREIRHSEKKDPGEHGLGLLHIKETVHKYNGTLEMEIADGVFCISLLIPMEEKPAPQNAG